MSKKVFEDFVFTSTVEVSDLVGINQPKWKLQVWDGIIFTAKKKPKLWTRFGIWLWFGQEGKTLSNNERKKK